MSRFKINCLLFCALCFCYNCQKEEITPPDSSPDSPPESGVPTIIPTGEERYLNEKSDYIFNQEVLHTFELQLPDAALAKIDANPAAEQYVEGMLIFEGDTISPVGIRYKGSIGGFVDCVSGSDWSNPSGRKTCTKLSMKVKINWDGREEKFFKLKKLQFHSQNLDPSQMHDRLGYWLFQQMGVPAPRATHARLLINGNYSGLYSLVEQIDGRFAKYNFEDDDGNLYKEVWPLSMAGKPHSEQTYLNALKTNEDENPSVALIRDFGQRIADASDSDLPSVIRETMDIDEIISLAVVDRTIRNDDGAFHWYCNGSSCTNHNYYWYEEPNEQQLHLIPWDLDNAFDNIIVSFNPVTTIADDWGEISNDCEAFSYGFFGLRQWSASCDKLTGGWASFEEEFEAKKEQFINGPFAAAQVDELLETWSNQIRAATIEANNAHPDAITEAEWNAALKKLKQQIEYARNK